MENSQRDLFIDMVVERFIFKNNLIMLSLCFTFTPKTGVELPKTGVSFYVEGGRKSTLSHFTSINILAYFLMVIL